MGGARLHAACGPSAGQSSMWGGVKNALAVNTYVDLVKLRS